MLSSDRYKGANGIRSFMMCSVRMGSCMEKTMAMSDRHNTPETKLLSSYSFPSHVFSTLVSPSHPKVPETSDTAGVFRPLCQRSRRRTRPYSSSEVTRGHHELLVASPVTRVGGTCHWPLSPTGLVVSIKSHLPREGQWIAAVVCKL